MTKLNLNSPDTIDNETLLRWVACADASDRTELVLLLAQRLEGTIDELSELRRDISKVCHDAESRTGTDEVLELTDIILNKLDGIW